MAGTSSVSANSFQRTIFMVELQTAMGVVATLAEDSLAVFILRFTNAQLMVLLTFLQASTYEYLKRFPWMHRTVG